MKTNGFKRDKKAVSPVIGVILMVAITVILAAVIAAFVFGMGSSLKKTYTVAATASRTGTNTVVITYQGGPDASFVTGLMYNVNGTTQGGTYPQLNYTVGSRVTISDPSNIWISGGKTNPVTVVANFTDGTQQVILDTNV